jgi:hypothetical protein
MTATASNMIHPFNKYITAATLQAPLHDLLAAEGMQQPGLNVNLITSLQQAPL